MLARLERFTGYVLTRMFDSIWKADNGDGQIARVVERKYFTCPSRESNPCQWIYRQTLHHVAVKAGLYRKAVEVYLYIPRPCDIHPLQFEIRPWISW